jgi:hypothetical protein
MAKLWLALSLVARSYRSGHRGWRRDMGSRRPSSNVTTAAFIGYDRF